MVGEEESQVMAQLFGSQEMFCFDHSSHCDLFDWNQGSYDGTSSASVLPHVAANYAEDNYLIKNGGPASTFTNQEEKVEWQGWRRCLEVPKKKGSKKGKNSLSKRTEKSDDNVGAAETGIDGDYINAHFAIIEEEAKTFGIPYWPSLFCAVGFVEMFEMLSYEAFGLSASTDTDKPTT
ncbi:uncharacterized protein LOC121990921 [Zingiber officinale]|uniref:uncharacterized protein LOC121990921 n=1 Tax=Zingiber officinale TaxID=94328 RepID=UPI001C4AC4FC|nr:uncharacterized protein LOC121990921 [Zingiber officinale]